MCACACLCACVCTPANADLLCPSRPSFSNFLDSLVTLSESLLPLLYSTLHLPGVQSQACGAARAGVHAACVHPCDGGVGHQLPLGSRQVRPPVRTCACPSAHRFLLWLSLCPSALRCSPSRRLNLLASMSPFFGYHVLSLLRAVRALAGVETPVTFGAGFALAVLSLLLCAFSFFLQCIARTNRIQQPLPLQLQSQQQATRR